MLLVQLHIQSLLHLQYLLQLLVTLAHILAKQLSILGPKKFAIYVLF